jgi:hypothetical protein
MIYNTKSRDVWVVVFHNDEELWLLEKQLQGLILHKNLYDYNIIINETGPAADHCKFRINDILERNQDPGFNIKVFLGEEFFHQFPDCMRVLDNTPAAGWIHQQVLKLLVYSASDKDEHIILDAKNIPIKDYCIDLVDSSFELNKGENIPAFHGFELFLKDKLNIVGDPISISCITPFLFEHKTLVHMHQVLDYSEFFVNSPSFLPSEFSLYVNFLKTQNLPINMNQVHGHYNNLRLDYDNPEYTLKKRIPIKPFLFLTIHRYILEKVGIDVAIDDINRERIHNNKVIRVAVCWGGMTRDLIEVVSHNKTLFDSVSAVPGNNIKFDHFCQFWSKDNKFPYKLDESIDASVIDDIIPDESISNVLKIIDILNPKSTITNNFKDMSGSVINFLNKNVSGIDSNNYCNFFDNETINKSTFKNFDQLYHWAEIHGQYCQVINRLAQFYVFEQSVLLAKEYSLSENFDFDVILRLRYDTALMPSDMHRTFNQIHCAVNTDNCIITHSFTYTTDDSHNTLDYDINMKTITNVDSIRYGIIDVIIIGSSHQMYRLADNLFNNVSDVYSNLCSTNTIDRSITQEILWFNEVYNKQILCVSNDLLTYALCRQAIDLDRLKMNGFDVRKFVFENIANKIAPTGLRKANGHWPNRFLESYFELK